MAESIDISGYVTQPEAEAAFRQDLTSEEWEQLQALLRRAARELELLVGPLGEHDRQLVSDSLLDAVKHEWTNPDRFRSETDQSYSYQRFELPSGLRGRFWWPENLLDLFGIPRDYRGRLRVIPVGVSPAGRGWL